MRHLSLSAAFAATIFVCPGTALPQVPVFPGKPVQIIIAAVPGGSNEAEARLYAQKLNENTGQQFIVDFKPGAGGTIAAAQVAKAPPDGHTLLVVSPNFTVSPSVYKGLPYDTVKDLAAVTMLSKRPTVLMVHPSVPVKNAAEYFAHARANPGVLNFGTTGNGSSPHMNGAWMHSSANVKVTFVHYKGTGSLMPDLLSGRVHATAISFLSSLPHIKAGRTRALGISTSERSRLWPELPTIAEQGVAGFDYSSWLGIVTSGATPGPVLARVHAEFAKAGKAPEIAKKLEPDFVQIVLSTPEQFKLYIAEDVARWRALVNEAGIQMEQ